MDTFLLIFEWKIKFPCIWDNPSYHYIMCINTGPCWWQTSEICGKKPVNMSIVNSKLKQTFGNMFHLILTINYLQAAV